MKLLFLIFLNTTTLLLLGQAGYTVPKNNTNQISNSNKNTPTKPGTKPESEKPKNVITPPPNINKIWYVDAQTLPCDDALNGNCLLVKRQGDKDYEIFYGIIEGFDHEEGYAYTIEVKVPANASSDDGTNINCKLIRIISRKKISMPLDENMANISIRKIITLDVDSETFPCDNVSNAECLLVKHPGSKDYEIFYSTIENFNFVPGYQYRISVRVDNNDHYKLERIIYQKFIKTVSIVNNKNDSDPNKENMVIKTSEGKSIGITNIQTTSALDKKWYLRKFKQDEETVILNNNNNLYIELDTFKDKCTGQSICNRFEAVVRSDQMTSFQIDKLTPGYKTCDNINLEKIFFDLLKLVDKFEIKDDMLVLSKQWVYKIEFTSDPDKMVE